MHLQANLPKSKTCDIPDTIHPISPKFDNETHTFNGTSWVVHHSQYGGRSFSETGSSYISTVE